MLQLLRMVSIPQLRASWMRTLLVVAGTLTGVALIVGINVINTSVLANLRQTFAEIAGPADLEITLGVGEIGFPESTLATVRGVDGVRTALPLIRGTISLADAPEQTLLLFGADLTAEEDLARYRIVTVTDRRRVLEALEDIRSIFLTEAFAADHGFRVGDGIRLSTPHGVEIFTVRGLLRPDGLARAFGGQLAVMDLPAAQEWLAKNDRIDQIDVVLAANAPVDIVAARLRTALPATLTVASPQQRSLRYETIVASFQAMLTGLSLLCLIAGVFIIYNTTSTAALHRVLVMAALRRIGATPRQVFRLFMLEALILGSVGTILGIASGVVLARILTGLVTASMGVIFQLRFAANTQVIDGSQLAVIAAGGIGATLFASAFAARQVAHLDPLQVMRGQSRRPLISQVPSRLVPVWVVLVLTSIVALLLERRFKSIAWGNFGATLWNSSVIVIAIPVVAWLARALSALLARCFGAEGEVAAASLFRTPVRTGVTVAAVALVLTVGMLLASLERSFHRTTETYVEGFLRGDLTVSAVATEGGWLETPLPRSVAQEIAEIPGVAGVATVRALPGQLYRGERIGVGAGSDELIDPGRLPPGWYHEGDPVTAAAAVRAGRGANVSTSFSDRFDLHVGDSIELDTPTGPLELAIVGVVPDLISDRGSVLVSNQVLGERWGETTVSRIIVSLAPGEALAAVRQRIASRFGGRYRLKILSMRDVLDYHHEKVASAFAFTDAIQLLIVIVTIAGIFDLLLSAIVERRRELAVWRLVGADDRAVRRSVVVEAGTVGAIGAVLGVAVGTVTAWIWVAINFRYLLGYHLEFDLAGSSTVWYVVLVMLTTMLAGSIAARRAVREPILDAIHTE